MNKILFTFPGQGAQIPGMLHELDRQGEHGQLLRQASDILGEDVMTLDTPQALERTRAVQLCILIAGALISVLSGRVCRKQANVPQVRLLGAGLAVIGAILVFLP